MDATSISLLLAASGIIVTIVGVAFRYVRDATGEMAKAATEVHAVNEQVSRMYGEHIRTRDAMEDMRKGSEESDRRLWEELSRTGKNVAWLKAKIKNGG